MTKAFDLLGDPIKPDRKRGTPTLPRTDRDPFLIAEGQRTAISLSGGRTSAYLLWRVLQSNGGLPDCARVLFANTGLEHEATLEFVATIGQRWGVPIDWVEYRNTEDGFTLVDYETASRNGEPYSAVIENRRFLPNPVTRFCTTELKIRAMHRRLRALGWADDDDGWDQFIGIRADEPGRVSRIRARGTSTESPLETMCMPLADAGVGRAEVGAFWKQHPFDLKLPNEGGVTRHGNCVLCFLKPGAQVLSLVQEEPQRAVWWMQAEASVQSSGCATGDGARFRNDRPSYAQIHAYALAQADLFRQPAEVIANDLIERMRLDDSPAPDCFCGVGSD